MPKLTPSEAVFSLMGFALGGGITAALIWVAGGTAYQIQRDALISALVAGLFGLIIGAKP